MIHEITDPCSVLSLYDGWEETMIWSCLQGIMGKIYADGLLPPLLSGILHFLQENPAKN